MDTVDTSIEEAYQQHRGPVYGQLLAITRAPAAAEDLCQEAFLRLTREGRAGRMPDNIGAWLHRVAANLATSRGRRSRTVAGRRDHPPRAKRGPSGRSERDEQHRSNGGPA